MMNIVGQITTIATTDATNATTNATKCHNKCKQMQKPMQTNAEFCVANASNICRVKCCNICISYFWGPKIVLSSALG
jgi:hypothetical protein